MKYKFDPHIHTSETSSCAFIEAKSIVKQYHEKGFDGIVITDHYFKEYFDSFGDLDWNDKINAFLKGYRLAKTEGNKINFKVFLGMELRFNGCQNDFLIYGINEKFLFEHPQLYELSIKDFKSLTLDKNILIYQAHPCRYDFRMNISNFPEKPEHLYGMEVLNGNSVHDSSNAKAFDFATKNNLRMIAGSDFHIVNDLARTGITFDKKIENYTEFVASLKTNLYEIIGGQ